MAGNLAINFIGGAVPLVVALVTVPLYIRVLGFERYGFILIAWALLGYFGFLDFGLSRATTNAMAEALHRGDEDACKSSFWTTFCFNAVVGIVGGVLLGAAGTWLYGSGFISTTPEIRAEALSAWLWIGPMLSVTLLMGVGIGALEAHERFLSLNIMQTLGMVVGQITPLAAAMAWGADLSTVLPVMFVARAVQAVAILWLALRVSGLGWQPSFDSARLRQLAEFGGWLTVTNVIGPIMTTADQLVIGALRSAAAVPVYAVPMNIAQRTMLVPATVSRTLFPIFSRRLGRDGNDLVSDAVLAMSVIVTPMFIVTVLLAGPFLTLWLGAEAAQHSTLILQLLALGAWFQSFGYILVTALQGEGRPATVAQIHLIELLPYLALLLGLVHQAGATGAAIAWTIRVVADALLLTFACRLKARTAIALIPGAVGLALAFFIAREWDVETLTLLILSFVLVLLTTCVSWLVSERLRGLVRQFAAHLLKVNADVSPNDHEVAP
ncbi:MAG: flippase [Sphingopyxis sp.]|jgi:O-antigen/teichoic acid export membrane protein|nr:flippase [Sphingopyxis sp.]